MAGLINFVFCDGAARLCPVIRWQGNILPSYVMSRRGFVPFGNIRSCDGLAWFCVI
jgi:hypothetical protein